MNDEYFINKLNELEFYYGESKEYISEVILAGLKCAHDMGGDGGGPYSKFEEAFESALIDMKEVINIKNKESLADAIEGFAGAVRREKKLNDKVYENVSKIFLEMREKFYEGFK